MQMRLCALRSHGKLGLSDYCYIIIHRLSFATKLSKQYLQCFVSSEQIFYVIHSLQAMCLYNFGVKIRFFFSMACKKKFYFSRKTVRHILQVVISLLTSQKHRYRLFASHFDTNILNRIES